MDADWAARRLREIQTLMERSAVYRRAMAPATLGSGFLGCLVAWIGWRWPVDTVRGFVAWWIAAAVLAAIVALLMIRKQAIVDREPFWSAPTRRFAQALTPPLACGFCLGLTVMATRGEPQGLAAALPSLWMVLYGCALFSAGFFMPRGLKLFGLVFMGCGVLSLGPSLSLPADGMDAGQVGLAHVTMGSAFGLLHLFYGAYLYWTESREDGYRPEDH